MSQEDQLPVFCSSPQKELFWAILIEKAWAKINGSYFKISFGLQSFLSIHLTGIPATNINHNSFKFFKNGCWNTDEAQLNQCWQRIMGAHELHYSIFADARCEFDGMDSSSGILPEKDY